MRASRSCCGRMSDLCGGGRGCPGRYGRGSPGASSGPAPREPLQPVAHGGASIARDGRPSAGTGDHMLNPSPRCGNSAYSGRLFRPSVRLLPAAFCRPDADLGEFGSTYGRNYPRSPTISERGDDIPLAGIAAGPTGSPGFRDGGDAATAGMPRRSAVRVREPTPGWRPQLRRGGHPVNGNRAGQR